MRLVPPLVGGVTKEEGLTMKAIVAAIIAAILLGGCSTGSASSDGVGAFSTVVEPASSGWKRQASPPKTVRWVLDKASERCVFVVAADGSFEMSIWAGDAKAPRLAALIVEGGKGVDPNAKRFTKECGLPPLGDI